MSLAFQFLSIYLWVLNLTTKLLLV